MMAMATAEESRTSAGILLRHLPKSPLDNLSGWWLNNPSEKVRQLG